MKNLVVKMTAACLLLVSVAPAQTFNASPSTELGQARLDVTSGAPNLVEGREFSNPQSVALDTTASPPILYVADTGNHRVLGFRNASSFSNGAFADIIIGQKDRYSTLAQGPSTSLNSGLTSPTGIAVDSQGNLWVVDTGNNRILRYPKPASLNPGDLQIPDFVIGQKNLSTKTANNGGLSDSSISTTQNSLAFRTSLLFDPAGNLWFTDSGNNRVLRYPAASLNGPNGPSADVVLGQLSFTEAKTPPAPVPPQVSIRQVKTGLLQPSGMAFDPAGRLYVSDGLSRVLVYNPPFAIGTPASRILGVVLQVGSVPPPTVSEGTLGALTPNVIPPEGIFMVGSSPAVIDPANHRVVRYDPYDTWPPESQLFSPPAKQVLGQIDFVSSKANSGQPAPGEGSLNTPIQGTVFNNELFLADAGNHRVLVFPLQSGFFSRAARVLGQDFFYQGTVNLIEGREFSFYSSSFFDAAAMVVDSTSTPPRLFVSDTYNNRVLGFKDARAVHPGDKADLVIGQPDFTRNPANYPKNQADTPQDNTLFLPRGLVVDGDGSLWVADGGNGRVLRFSAPFNQPAGQMPKANLVLGQTGFFTQVTDATSRTMRSPFGVALTSDGHLLVSDSVHNRVLFFRKPAGGDFTSGQSAELVFGQPDSLKTDTGSQLNQMNAPRHIATDADDHLYVADTGNQRVIVFDRVTTAGANPTAAVGISGLSSPHGIFVNKTNGELWIAEASANRVSRFPSYDRLLAGITATGTIPSFGPLAVTLDGFGNLIVGESINRLAFYFPGLTVNNGANYSTRGVAPGTIASVFPQSTDLNAFGTETKVFETTPLPTDLADAQVLFNGAPAPLFFVANRQANFVVPFGAATSGTADIKVVRKSSGQILAAGQVALSTASPALFTTNGAGNGQLAALNVKSDGSSSANGPGNRVAWGETVVLFGTGQGFVNGAPPDGQPATGVVSTDEKPKIWLGSDFVPDANVSYSGLAPGLVGVWQINFKVPDSIVPSPSVQCFVILKSVPSNQGPNGILVTTISVKQP